MRANIANTRILASCDFWLRLSFVWFSFLFFAWNVSFAFFKLKPKTLSYRLHAHKTSFSIIFSLKIRITHTIQRLHEIISIFFKRKTVITLDWIIIMIMVKEKQFAVTLCSRCVCRKAIRILYMFLLKQPPHSPSPGADRNFPLGRSPQQQWLYMGLDKFLVNILILYVIIR